MNGSDKMWGGLKPDFLVCASERTHKLIDYVLLYRDL